MEAQERLVQFLRDKRYLSHAQYYKGRCADVKAAFDGDPYYDYAVSHVSDISYDQVCPRIFFSDMDSYAYRLMSCCPRKEDRPIEYSVYLRGACILILAFAGIDKELAARIRPSDIDFQKRTICVFGQMFELMPFSSGMIQEFLDLPLTLNAKGEGYKPLKRTVSFLFSLRDNEPVKVGALNKAVRFTTDVAHDHDFDTSAWIASVNGDFVRVRDLVSSGCTEKNALERIAFSRGRNLSSFSETYMAFKSQCM